MNQHGTKQPKKLPKNVVLYLDILHFAVLSILWQLSVAWCIYWTAPPVLVWNSSGGYGLRLKKNKIKKNRPLFFKLPILTRKTSSSEPCKYFRLNFVKEMTTPSTLGMTFVCLFFLLNIFRMKKIPRILFNDDSADDQKFPFCEDK